MNGTEYSELVGNMNSLSDALAREGYAYDAETITKAAQAIEALWDRGTAAKTAQGAWVSVGERLPEEEKDVLILVKETDNTFGTGHPDVCYWQFVGWMIDGRWETVYCHGNRAISDENARGNSVHQVTHWMPLPDLPEEE